MSGQDRPPSYPWPSDALASKHNHTADPATATAFRTNVWRNPNTKVWCIVGFAVLAMLFDGLLLAQGETSSFLLVEATIGAPSPAPLHCC